VVVIPNGIDLARYEDGAAIERHPHRAFYSSSPDRGLHHLLEGWPLVRERVPDAELWIFYEVEKWIPTVYWMMNELGRRAQIIRRYFDDPPPGVTFWGMVDPWVLARKQQACNLWAYPADLTQGTETFCITGLEAAAAGCAMLTTTGDCLGEVYGEVAALADLPLDVASFAEAVARFLTEPDLADQYRPGIDWARRYTWERVARQWEREIGRVLAGELAGEEGGEDAAVPR
jgi:glycosyltransferase involved in cell wall biosynthesis